MTEGLNTLSVLANRKINLHYNRIESYSFVNGVKICQLKAKNTELNAYQLCLGNISKYFKVDNLKRNGQHGCVYDSSVDYRSIDFDDILDIYKYLMKKQNIKQCNI